MIGGVTTQLAAGRGWNAGELGSLERERERENGTSGLLRQMRTQSTKFALMISCVYVNFVFIVKVQLTCKIEPTQATFLCAPFAPTN